MAVASTFLLLFPPQSGADVLSYAWLAPILVVLWVLALGITESRARRVVGAGLEEYRRVMTGSLHLFRLLAVVSYWLQAQLSRALFVTTLPIGVALLLIGRWAVRQTLARMRARGRGLTRTLVVGSAGAVRDVLSELKRHPEAGYAAGGVCLTRGDHAALGVLADGCAR